MTDYKEYSLEQLSTWVADAITCSGATPEEIFNKIKGVIEDEYHTYKNQTERCYELLALMNGNGKGHISAYDNYQDHIVLCDNTNLSEDCMNSWSDFWGEDTVKEDKVVKWQLPVEMDGPSGEYFVSFPDDLLEAAGLKEGDTVEWVDNGDGSYLLKKVENPT